MKKYYSISEFAKVSGDLKTKQFNGKREKRGLFKDHITGKVYNADLNQVFGECLKRHSR